MSVEAATFREVFLLLEIFFKPGNMRNIISKRVVDTFKPRATNMVLKLTLKLERGSSALM